MTRWWQRNDGEPGMSEAGSAAVGGVAWVVAGVWFYMQFAGDSARLFGAVFCGLLMAVVVMVIVRIDPTERRRRQLDEAARLGRARRERRRRR